VLQADHQLSHAAADDRVRAAAEVSYGDHDVAHTSSKINSAICSIFTSAYVFYWPKYFPNNELLYPPTFDSRVVLYSTDKEIRDYFAWRQADSELTSSV
jgi:tRNA(His) 5'-end guanylyltransferase